MLKSKRASHIDPPASSYAIMRKACPYRGENPGPGKDIHGELDPGPELENGLGHEEQAPPGRLSDRSGVSKAVLSYG